jgi:hypothetical protein
MLQPTTQSPEKIYLAVQFNVKGVELFPLSFIVNLKF